MKGKISKFMKKDILLIGIIFILLLPSMITTISSFTEAEPSTITSTGKILPHILYVGGSGPNNYTSIQEAINAANDGDTIIVYPGRYTENVVVYKELKIIGIDHPVIEAENKSKNTVKIVTSNCFIQGFKIINGRNGIKMFDCTNIHIKDCIFDENNYSSLYLENVYHVFIINNTFYNENIYARESGVLTISGNYFTNEGISGERIYEAKICHNQFFKGEWAAIAILSPYSHDNEIFCNQIKSFYTGIEIQGTALVYHNNIISNEEGIWCGGVIHRWEGKMLIYENNFSGNYVGINLMDIPWGNIEITKNNFIGNEFHAGFLDSYFVLWHENYWDDWKIPLPRPIFGRILWFVPWIQFDWHPSMQPYEWWKE